MLAIEVLVNGERHVLAGFEDWGLLSVSLHASRADGAGREVDELEMAIGGLALQAEPGRHEGVRWGNRGLQVGDEVTLRFVDTALADPPLRRYRSDATVQEEPFTEAEIEAFQRKDYARLKAKFEPGG